MFWNGVSEPSAHYYNGKTYVCGCDDSKNIWAASYDHATLTWSTPVNIGNISTAVDGAIHVAPCILVRSSDHRIMVFGVANGTGQPGYWLSTNPEDATAWGSVVLFGTSATYTYVSCAQLNGVTNSPIYLFVKHWSGGIGYLSFYKSTDGGSTWSGPTDLIGPVSSSTIYWRIGNDANTRIDIFASTTDRAPATPASVYHFKFVGDVLYKSDGTPVGGSTPVVANTGTLIQDASLGSARCNGWAYSGGNPRALILINTSNANTDTAARCAVWTGSAWTVTDVASVGGVIGGNEFIAGGAMTKDDPFTIWMPKLVSSHYEMFRYTSGDGGATWAGQAVTSGSSVENAMPDTPFAGVHGLQVVWGHGTYTSDSAFSFVPYGAGN